MLILDKNETIDLKFSTSLEKLEVLKIQLEIMIRARNLPKLKDSSHGPMASPKHSPFTEKKDAISLEALQAYHKNKNRFTPPSSPVKEKKREPASPIYSLMGPAS